MGTSNYTSFAVFNSLKTLSEIDSFRSNQMGKHKCFNGISLLLPKA